jgi:hypothetical protein
MVDQNIACVSAGSVYNVIKRHHPGKKRAEAVEMTKHGFNQPKAVHEQPECGASGYRDERAVSSGRTPRLISDNGSQFIAKDFQELPALLEADHTFISANHPPLLACCKNGKFSISSTLIPPHSYLLPATYFLAFSRASSTASLNWSKAIVAPLTASTFLRSPVSR